MIDDADIRARLIERLDMLDALIDNNSRAFLTTPEQTLTASKTIQFIRDCIANGEADSASALLGHMVTFDVLWPMIEESTSKFRSLSDSKIRWAEAVTNAAVTSGTVVLKNKRGDERGISYEDLGDVLNTDERSVTRFLQERHRREGLPARKRGRPKKAKT